MAQEEVDAISFLRQRYGGDQTSIKQPGPAVDWLRSRYAVAPATEAAPTEGPGVMDYAGQGASSFAKGALETGRSLLDFPSTMGMAGAGVLGIPETADTLRTLSPHYWAARGLQALERMVPTNAKVDAEQGGAAKWMSETGANALGSTLPFLGVGAIAKGAGATARAATAITALTGASVNAVSGYEDAIRSGATPEQAFGALLINGGLGALEAATPARILARIDAKVGGGLGKAITNAFIEGGTEAMTEMIQQLGQDAYAAMSFDEQREISQGLADAAGGGGFAGVLMSLLGSGMARGHQAQAAQPKPGAAVQPAPSQTAQEPVSEGQITKDGPTLQPNDARVSGALESLTRKAGEPVTVVEDQKGYEWEADRARMAGTPLVLFRVGEGKGEGENVPTGFSRGGVTFLNADLPVPERKKAVLYHELGHRLFETDEASWKAKYDEIGALAPELLKRAGDRYEANFGEKLSPEAKSEEAYSALAEELPGFIRAWEENPSQFTETKRGFVRKIIDWLSEKLGMESSVTKELKALRDQIAETDFEKSADPKLLRDVSRVFAKGFAELENAPAAEPIQMGSTMVEAPGAAPSETPLQVSEPIASRKPRAVGPQPVEMPSGDLYDEQGRPIVGSWGRGPQAVEAKGPTTTKGDLSVPEPAPEPELPTKPSPLTRKSKAQLEQDLERALQTERERVELVFQDRGKLWRERFIELRQSARREPSPAQEAAAKQVRAVEAQLRPRALEVLQGGHEPGMNAEAIMGALRAKEAEGKASRLERRSTNREESRAAGEKAQEAARRVGTEERFAIAPKGNFATPDETHADTFLRKIQDRYRRLSVIQGAISRKQAISESADAEQKVRLFPSRLRTRFEKVEGRQKKVVEILSKNKISVEDAGEFVYALGAEQRNATMAKRSPRKFGTAANPGSGMTDAEAQRIQAEAYAKNKDAYEALRDEVASMNKAKFDMAEEAGFLNAEGRTAWEEAFGPYHAPLYTWEKESDDAFSGLNTRNFNNAERLSKKAKGRMSLADNPLVSLIDSMAKWSVRAETNRVGQTLGNLIEEAPDPVLWEPIDSMSKAKPEDQVFSFWKDGEKKLVILHDAKLARAMKSIGVEPAGELLRMAQGVRTTYSKLHTSWNPEFILPNLIKDAGAAAVTLNLERGPAFASKALNPNRIRESFFAILNDTNGKPSKLSKDIAEWKDRGGMTGWSLQPETLHKRMKQLDKAVSLAANDTTGKQIVNAFMSGKKLMESLSESAENAVRFSVYRTFIEAGASPDEAARQSKTITIDFDARGEISTPFNVLYLFFNANVQGTARIFQAAKKAPPHRLITTGAALATFGYFVSYINRILADDDENGVNRWDTVSQNDKAHNLSLMFGDKRTILPLPWGWSLFTYLGQQVEALQNGRYKPEQAAGDFTAQSFDSFSPVQGATPTQFLAPWFADPFIQVFENEDFAGRSIMPREDPFKRYKTPDSYRYFPDVDPSLRKAADAMNRWTGGDQVNPGAIDMSPEAMEHLAGEAAGGFGRVIGRVAKMIDKLGHGESLKLSEAPVLRRFMQEAPQWFTYKLFSENLTEVERHEELRKNRMPFDAAVVGQGRSTRNQIEEINRAIKRLPDGPVKKRMEDRKLEVEQRFNRFMESRQR